MFGFLHPTSTGGFGAPLTLQPNTGASSLFGSLGGGGGAPNFSTSRNSFLQSAAPAAASSPSSSPAAAAAKEAPRPGVLLVGTTPSAAHAWRVLHRTGFTITAVLHTPSEAEVAAHTPAAGAADAKFDLEGLEAVCERRAQEFIRACIAAYDLPSLPPKKLPDGEAAATATTGGSGGGVLLLDSGKAAKPEEPKGGGDSPKIQSLFDFGDDDDYSPYKSSGSKPNNTNNNINGTTAAAGGVAAADEDDTPSPFRGITATTLRSFTTTTTLLDSVDVVFVATRAFVSALVMHKPGASPAMGTGMGFGFGGGGGGFGAAAANRQQQQQQQQQQAAQLPTQSAVDIFVLQCAEKGKHIVVDFPMAARTEVFNKWMETVYNTAGKSAKAYLLDSSAGIWWSARFDALRTLAGVPVEPKEAVAPAPAAAAKTPAARGKRAGRKNRNNAANANTNASASDAPAAAAGGNGNSSGWTRTDTKKAAPGRAETAPQSLEPHPPAEPVKDALTVAAGRGRIGRLRRLRLHLCIPTTAAAAAGGVEEANSSPNDDEDDENKDQNKGEGDGIATSGAVNVDSLGADEILLHAVHSPASAVVAAAAKTLAASDAEARRKNRRSSSITANPSVSPSAHAGATVPVTLATGAAAAAGGKKTRRKRPNRSPSKEMQRQQAGAGAGLEAAATLSALYRPVYSLGALGDVAWCMLSFYLALFAWRLPAGIMARVLAREPGTGRPTTIEGELLYCFAPSASTGGGGGGRARRPWQSPSRKSPAESPTKKSPGQPAAIATTTAAGKPAPASSAEEDGKSEGSTSASPPPASSIVEAKFYVSCDPGACLAQELTVCGTEGTLVLRDAFFPLAEDCEAEQEQERERAAQQKEATATAINNSSGRTVNHRDVQPLPRRVGKCTLVTHAKGPATATGIAEGDDGSRYAAYPPVNLRTETTLELGAAAEEGPDALLWSKLHQLLLSSTNNNNNSHATSNTAGSHFGGGGGGGFGFTSRYGGGGGGFGAPRQRYPVADGAAAAEFLTHTWAIQQTVEMLADAVEAASPRGDADGDTDTDDAVNSSTEN